MFQSMNNKENDSWNLIFFSFAMIWQILSQLKTFSCPKWYLSVSAFYFLITLWDLSTIFTNNVSYIIFTLDKMKINFCLGFDSLRFNRHLASKPHTRECASINKIYDLSDVNWWKTSMICESKSCVKSSVSSVELYFWTCSLWARNTCWRRPMVHLYQKVL